jgi:general secretion pathway protein G
MFRALQHHRYRDLPHDRRPVRAFTLIEILIVVVILGILATIVVPQFSSATQSTRENMLKDDLRYIRTQLSVFSAQHSDVSPGYPNGDRTAAPSEAEFVAQMTSFTSETCVTSPTRSGACKYGPYLVAIPRNPLNDSTSVLVIANGNPMRAPANDGYGWIYRPQTQEFIANLPGTDSTGTPYASY